MMTDILILYPLVVCRRSLHRFRWQLRSLLMARSTIFPQPVQARIRLFPIILRKAGTTEICIFCHTPHSGNTEAPLWNRASSARDYQTYTSDVLAGLGGAAAIGRQRTRRTGFLIPRRRICLSCHDGTIALGSVVNMPDDIPTSYPSILMSGSSNILSSASGYIGLDLRDDHPVAIRHDSGRDTELVPGASVVYARLYRDGGGGEDSCRERRR